MNGAELVADYGDALAEHAALRETAGVLDLSFRSRLCLTGADRVRFLHGQITNDVKRLHPGEGCYAALVTAKGKMQSDMNVFGLADELLLDFEPGLTQPSPQRLEKFLVADDVQVVDVAPHYGLLSVQGPTGGSRGAGRGLFTELPARNSASVKIADATLRRDLPDEPFAVAALAPPGRRQTKQWTAGASEARPRFDWRSDGCR